MLTAKDFLLSDDGTLDTVIACKHCGEELRYNFDGSDCVTSGDSQRAYHEFVKWAKADAADQHECEVQP